MKKYKYYILSLGIVLADQITKALIIAHVPVYSVAWSFGGDFFRLIHVKNLGAAFSLGHNLPPFLRIAVIIIIPCVILILAAVYVVARSSILNEPQRWALAGAIGGGLGNQIDRIFRSTGVVDFLDFKFYGIFGMERWPTFNLADSTIVLSVLFIVLDEHNSKKRKTNE